MTRRPPPGYANTSGQKVTDRKVFEMTRAEIERANAAHNLEATRFVSMEEMRAATRRRPGLQPGVIVGIIVGLLLTAALLAAYHYHETHDREAHPPAARLVTSNPH